MGDGCKRTREDTKGVKGGCGGGRTSGAQKRCENQGNPSKFGPSREICKCECDKQFQFSLVRTNSEVTQHLL